jgi:hypothetical protein
MDFDLTNIRNLTIQKRFRQIPIADVDFYNLTTDQATLMVEGRPQNYFINGFHHFTGVIKRVDKDDNKPIWKVHSEGAGCILRDTTLDIDKVYKNTPIDTILTSLLPDNWTLDVSAVTTMPKIWYHVTPGSALSHLSNIVRLSKLEWEVDQSVGLGDVYGNYIFRVSPHLGSTTPTTYYTNNTNCFNLIQKQNQDKVFTAIQAVGSSPESARMTSIITADCPLTQFSTLLYSESYLTSSISATATIIPVADPSGYFPPGLINIDGEHIWITTKSASNLITTTASRGYAGTTAAGHMSGLDVLNLHEFRFSPDISFANAGIIIGSEQMSYQYKQPGRVYGNIARNIKGITSSGTTAYAHHAGANVRVIYDPTYNTPDPTSYASINGIRQTTIDAMGAIDQDGVDLKAGIIVTKTATSQPYGSLYSTETDVWKEVTLGDRILVTQAATWIDSTTDFASHLPDGTTETMYGVPCKIKSTPEVIDTRIIGITWNQYKPVFIEYGDVDMFILDDFANAAKAYNTAINRNDNTTTATVIALDANDPLAIIIRNKWGELLSVKKV